MYERGPSDRTEMPLGPRVVQPGTFQAIGAPLIAALRDVDGAHASTAATLAPLAGVSLENDFAADVVPAYVALGALDRLEDAADHAAMVNAAAAAGLQLDDERSQLPGRDEDVPSGIIPSNPSEFPHPPGEGRPGIPPPETQNPPPPEGTGPGPNVPPPEPPPGQPPGPQPPPGPQQPPPPGPEAPIPLEDALAQLNADAIAARGYALTTRELFELQSIVGYVEGTPVTRARLNEARATLGRRLREV